MVDKELLQAISDTMDGKLESIKQEISDTMDGKFELIKQEISDVKQEVRDIKLTLENETNVGIKIIGEGHAILNRRLDEALKVTSEQEVLLLRVAHLENELRRIKEQLQADIA